MAFNSLIFLIVFLPLFLLLFYVIPKKYKYLIVLFCSVIFYLYSGLFNFFLLIGICIFNYIATRLLSRKNISFLWYLLIILNIIVLCLFKYGISSIFPLGISFYTFNNISYIVDIKRKKIDAEKNILYYMTYILLFCHITMGPLVRYNDLKESIINPNIDYNDSLEGFRLFIWNLIKKVLIADNLGMLYSTLMSNSNSSSLLNIICLIVFGLQLYIDFSSYSNMVIGLGKMIGIKYPVNFDYPYLSLSISEFWRRWHISLSNFFKEYIYFPLGGNRVNTFRHIINIMIIWIITGIWHGNTFNFIIWGLYYGIILLLEKYFFNKLLDKVPNFIKHIYVLLIVLIGYIFFSINDINEIVLFTKSIFTSPFMNNIILFYLKENWLLLIISIILCFRLPSKLNDFINKPYIMFICNILLIVLYIVSICYIVSGSYLPFLYNNF